jgi:trimeric autotransporter adhesin
MATCARILVLLALAACSFPRPPDVKDPSVTIGGTVHGLWTGADGVALRLTANGVDTIYTAPSNGPFSFPVTLVEDDSYVVAVASNPVMHTCQIAAGANGLVPAGGVSSIDVACTGPAVTIALSSPEPWTFDPTQDVQPTLDASLLLQELSVTVDGPGLITSAKVTGEPVLLGRSSTPQLLPLGEVTFDVELAAQGNLSKTYTFTVRRGARLISQAVYGKASNSGGLFGVNIAVSGDTLAVSATAESSNATGVNGDQANTGAMFSGAVYVFQRIGTIWVQQAYIKASNTQALDAFGASVALSGDTLAVGASSEDSAATGVNQNQADNSIEDSGAVYIFQRIGTAWTQQAYVKPSDTESRQQFGGAVALSGGTLAVGAIGETSSATGVDGDQTNRGASRSGAVYVFQRFGPTWTQQAYIKASNTGQEDLFGSAVALSNDTLAVGAVSEGSSATGINGDQFNNDAPSSGAVYVFVRTGGSWSQQAYIKGMNTGPGRGFGFGNELAITGDTLAVGASRDSSAATGVNGDPTDNGSAGSGAVYVFQRTASAWSQQAYIKASNTGRSDLFGTSIALQGDILAVGATQEASGATGVGGDQTNDGAPRAGAAYVFRRTGTTWTQHAYLKASNTDGGDTFGSSIAVSEHALIVGATHESSGATGIDGDQQNNGAPDSGAIYVFR